MQSTAYHAVSVEALLLDNRMKPGNFSWLLLKKKTLLKVDSRRRHSQVVKSLFTE